MFCGTNYFGLKMCWEACNQVLKNSFLFMASLQKGL